MKVFLFIETILQKFRGEMKVNVLTSAVYGSRWRASHSACLCLTTILI
jgi:hypothetical protein